MKIIIPYDPDTFFSMEEYSLFSLLQLTDQIVLNQVLENWTTFATGTADEIYERVVDDLYDHYGTTYREGLESKRLQTLLSQHADTLVQCLQHTAIQLQHVLDGLPEEARRLTYDTGDYYYLRVESINKMGKFAMITTDVYDNPL